MHFRTFHGSAVPAPLIEEIAELARRSGASLNSCDRSKEAEAILRSNGKRSQHELRQCFEERLRTGICPPRCGGNCNPANKPGRSTHERRNDGVAYAGPAGMPLRYWQVGMDWSDPAAVMAAARSLGWVATITYPDNALERHHLNLRKEATLNVLPTLRVGSKGVAVVELTRRLSTITRPGPYLSGAQRRFGDDIEAAVKRFQADHHLADDGVVGTVTWSQLAVAVRRERKRRKEERQGLAPAPSRKARGPLNGPDVSKFQGDVDWPRVRRSGCEFAFVRVADGDLRDRWYSPRRVQAVRSAGLVLGVYYYGRVASPGNSHRDGRAEAKMAIGFAKEFGWGAPGDLPLAYDFEETNGQTPQQAARHLVEFVSEYEAAQRHLPILYTMPGFFSSVLPHLDSDDRRMLRRCPLWVAHWAVSEPRVPEPWSGYTLWQHTDRGTVSGVTGPCDLNVGAPALRDLRRVLIGA